MRESSCFFVATCANTGLAGARRRVIRVAHLSERERKAIHREGAESTAAESEHLRARRALPPPTPRMESATTPAAPIVVPERLSVGEIAKANKAAQLDGVGAGGVTGFLGGFISHRLFKMSRNVSLISGLM